MWLSSVAGDARSIIFNNHQQMNRADITPETSQRVIYRRQKPSDDTSSTVHCHRRRPRSVANAAAAAAKFSFIPGTNGAALGGIWAALGRRTGLGVRLGGTADGRRDYT